MTMTRMQNVGSVAPDSDAMKYAQRFLKIAAGSEFAEGDDFLSLAQRLFPHLTAQFDEDGDRRYQGLRSAPDLHDEFAALERSTKASDGGPCVSLARWPGGATFALFLSHDVDVIHERELFRILGGGNRMRRKVFSGDLRGAAAAFRGITRAVLRPKPARRDFERILEIEGRHGFRSTFYMLHDRYFARHGARYSFKDKEILEIGRMALDAGCELGVHGGYYRFNNADLYRESREAVESAFGVEAIGIRNHYLRFSYPETWRAQAKAGFEYDATYGYRSVPGPRSGLAFPFFTYDQEAGKTLDLLEFPLTIMDVTVFQSLRLKGEGALEFCGRLAERLADHGALISLLWHNNYFEDPEFHDWQVVYQKLLELLAARNPWCAPGAEISRWWRARGRVEVMRTLLECGEWEVTVRPGTDIEGLALQIRDAAKWAKVTVTGQEHGTERTDGCWKVMFPRLTAGGKARVRLVPA